MRPYLIAGNWKMNGTIPETESLIQALLESVVAKDGVGTIVCPPFPSLETAARLLKGSPIGLGGQNMSEHEKGAYTGEVSAGMLLTVGARWVILGHSERRQYYGETDRGVNAKARRALDAGLTPIICVGELLEEREAGRTETVVKTQVEGCLAGFSPEDLGKTVIAYEPVWAIGTGKTATPEMAQEVHALIRQRLAAIDKTTADRVVIQYGGSVKPGNAEGLLGQPDIDGALVGGASLKADEFVGIINAVRT